MGKSRGRNFLHSPPPPLRQGQTFHAPLLRVESRFAPPPPFITTKTSSYCIIAAPKPFVPPPPFNMAKTLSAPPPLFGGIQLHMPPPPPLPFCCPLPVIRDQSLTGIITAIQFQQRIHFPCQRLDGEAC